MTPSTKKRKGNPGPSTLQEAYEESIRSVRVHLSLQDYLNSRRIEQHPEELFELIHGIYKANIIEVNTHVVPAAFRPFTIFRNAHGSVTGIADIKSKIRLEDSKLVTILMIEGARSLNAKDIIVENGESSSAYLLVPHHVCIEKVKEAAKEKDVKRASFSVYGLKRQNPIFLDPLQLKSILSLPYVDLGAVTKIVNDANQIAKNADLPDATKLASLKDLISLMTLQTSKRKVLSLYQTLMTSALAKASDEEKIQAFEKCPSATLARELKLPTIYQGTLFTPTKANAPKVNFANLDDEDLVTMSKIPVSESEYKGFPADLAGENVYKFSDSLGTIRNRSYVKATAISGMPKDLVQRYYAAAAKSQGREKHEASSDSGDDDEEMKDFKVF